MKRFILVAIILASLVTLGTVTGSDDQFTPSVVSAEPCDYCDYEPTTGGTGCLEVCYTITDTSLGCIWFGWCAPPTPIRCSDNCVYDSNCWTDWSTGDVICNSVPLFVAEDVSADCEYCDYADYNGGRTYTDPYVYGQAQYYDPYEQQWCPQVYYLAAC